MFIYFRRQGRDSRYPAALCHSTNPQPKGEPSSCPINLFFPRAAVCFRFPHHCAVWLYVYLFDLGCEVFVKRDDLTGIGFGGNKLRKLDYLIADARQKNCRMLVTSGSLQTNHGMLTAICAAKTGLHCVLFLLVEEPDCKKNTQRKSPAG